MNPTPRQIEILTLASIGFSNKLIGNKLGIQEQTVKNIMSDLYDRMGVFDRTHAVATALRLGMI